MLGNSNQSIVTSWIYVMWHDAIKIKALPLQPTEAAYIYVIDFCHPPKFDSVWRWVHVKRTSEGLWHTPAASLGSRLCGTGLLVPVRAGCVLVGGAGRWLAGEGAGRNVEHWEKAELVYFRYKMSPNSLRMYWTSQHSPGCAGVSVLSTFVNVVNIIHSKLSWLHPLPARRKPLPLQRMAPMSGVCVVINVIPPASNRPINSPARRKSRLLPAHGRQITHRLCWHTANC